MNKLIMGCALLALTGMTVAGCNTVEGFGRDLQQVGGVLTGTANDVQNGATQPPRTDRPACQPDAEGNVLEGCAH